MESIVDLYDKGISVGSMSKVFSMAGLRMGWIATKSEEVLHLCHERRDYDTISCGVIDDKLAALALANKGEDLCQKSGYPQQEPGYSGSVGRGNAGGQISEACGRYDGIGVLRQGHAVHDLCVRLIKEKGVLFTPGECFEMEGAVRIGYAYDSRTLREGLEKFTEFLREL